MVTAEKLRTRLARAEAKAEIEAIGRARIKKEREEKRGLKRSIRKLRFGKTKRILRTIGTASGRTGKVMVKLGAKNRRTSRKVLKGNRKTRRKINRNNLKRTSRMTNDPLMSLILRS